LKPLLDKIGVTARIEANRPAAAKKALLELMDAVEMKVHHFRKECWNFMIELIADHVGLMQNPWKYSLPDVKWKGPISKPSYHGFQELKKQIPTELIEDYIKTAKASPWDYLGDVFSEEELAGRSNRLGQMLTPRGVVEMMVQMNLGMNNQKPYSYAKPDRATLMWQTAEALLFNEALPINLLAERARRHTVLNLTPLLVKYEPQPITDLDPATGTGRFLLVATLMYPKLPLLLYGIEIDLSLYRACLVNMAMFSNHPYSIVCANTLMLDPHFDGPAGNLWNYGNQWDPPDISQFYFKITPPFKFSLSTIAKEYAKEKKEPITVQSTTPKRFSLAEMVRAKQR
jgi:hypothetical protein